MLYSSFLLLLVLMTVRIGRPEKSDEELICNEPDKHDSKHFNSMTKQTEQIKKRDKHDSQHQSTFYESILKDANDNAMTKKFESINNVNEDYKNVLEKDIIGMKDVDDITSSRKMLNREQSYDSPSPKSSYKKSKDDNLELNERNTISLKEKQIDESLTDGKDGAINLKESEGKNIQKFIHLMSSFNDPFNSAQEGISALSKKDCHIGSGDQNFYSREIINQPKASYYKAADKTEPKHNYAFCEVSQSNKYPYKVCYNPIKPPSSVFTSQKDHKAHSIIPHTHRDKPDNEEAYNITSLASSLGNEISQKYEKEYFGKIDTKQNYPDNESKFNYLNIRPSLQDNFTVLKNINLDPSEEINMISSLNLNDPHNICQLEYRNIANDLPDANDKYAGNTLSKNKGASVKNNSVHQNSKLFIKCNDLSDQLLNKYDPFRNEMNQKYSDLLHSSNNIGSVESDKSVLNKLKSIKNFNNDNLTDGFRSRASLHTNPSRFKPSNEKIYVPEYEKMNDLYCDENSQSYFKGSILGSGSANNRESDPGKGNEGTMYWSRLPLSSCLDHIFNCSNHLNLKQDFERQLYKNLNEGFVIIPLNRYMGLKDRDYMNNAENNNRISTVDTSYSHFFKPVGSELHKHVRNNRMNVHNVALTETKQNYPVRLTQDQAVESESAREQMEMATRSNNSTLMCIPPTNKWTFSSSLRPDLFLHRVFINT